MIYCPNPQCQHRQNQDEQEYCANCGTSLLIKNRYRLLKPLRSLNIEHHTEIWQADDHGQLKVLKILHTNKPKLIALLEREAEALQKLAHPEIPQVSKNCLFTISPHKSAENLHCLVMEYIEGKNLEQVIEKSGKISQYKALDWLQQILEILDYVHKNGYFHRDIKPSNLILKPNGKLSLIDFGSVRVIRSSFLVKSRLALAEGNLADFLKITKIISEGFTAPEQVEGKALPQSDFYALGRTFVYFVTGIHPLHLYSPHSNKLIWRQEARQISKPLADLIDDLMQPSPASRPQNPQAIAQRLTKWNLLWREWVSWQGLGWGFIFVISLGLCWQVGTRVIAKSYFDSVQEYLAKNKSIPIPQDESEKQELIAIIENLQKAVQLNPYNYQYKQELAQANVRIGQYLLQQEQLSLARQKFTQAIQLNPKEASAYNNLGLTCKLEYDFSCAINNYQKALSISSNQKETVIIHYNLAGLFEQIGNLDAANQEYLIVISLASAQSDLIKMSIRATNNYSRLQIMYSDGDSLSLEILQNSLKKTQQLLDALESQSPQPEDEKLHLLNLQSTLLKNIGWAYLQKGDLIAAQTALQESIDLEQQALKLAPNNQLSAAPYCLLAQVLQYSKPSKSLELWLQCREYQNENNLPEVKVWQLYAQQLLKIKGVL